MFAKCQADILKNGRVLPYWTSTMATFQAISWDSCIPLFQVLSDLGGKSEPLSLFALLPKKKLAQKYAPHHASLKFSVELFLPVTVDDLDLKMINKS